MYYRDKSWSVPYPTDLHMVSYKRIPFAWPWILDQCVFACFIEKQVWLMPKVICILTKKFCFKALLFSTKKGQKRPKCCLRLQQEKEAIYQMLLLKVDKKLVILHLVTLSLLSTYDKSGNESLNLVQVICWYNFESEFIYRYFWYKKGIL